MTQPRGSPPPRNKADVQSRRHAFPFVMAGLDPAISGDPRAKPGDDVELLIPGRSERAAGTIAPAGLARARARQTENRNKPLIFLDSASE